MPFSDLKIEWPAGPACDARDLCLEIEILERRVRRQHRELAAEDFAGARGALVAAKAGGAPRGADGGGRCTPPGLCHLQGRKRGNPQRGLPDPAQGARGRKPVAFHKELAAIAGMVAMLYRTLGQAKEEREWRVAAILDFDKAVEMFAARVGRLCQPAWVHSPEQGRFFKDVEAIDPDFVQERADGSRHPRPQRGVRGTSRLPARRPARRSKPRLGA